MTEQERNQQPTARNRERRARFIQQLAHFLVEDQAAKSMLLEMEARLPETPIRRHWAKEWASLRATVPLNGYPTLDEAITAITRFLA